MKRKSWTEYGHACYGYNIHGMGIYVDSKNKDLSWLDIEVATPKEYECYIIWLKEKGYKKELREDIRLYEIYNGKKLK